MSEALRREYNEKIQQYNSDPTHPEYGARCKRAKEEYNTRLRKALGELPAMHFPKEDI